MDIACFSVLSSVVIFFVYKLAKDELSPEGRLLLTRLTAIIPRFEGDRAAVKSALFCGYIMACLVLLVRLVFAQAKFNWHSGMPPPPPAGSIDKVSGRPMKGFMMRDIASESYSLNATLRYLPGPAHMLCEPIQTLGPGLAVMPEYAQVGYYGNIITNLGIDVQPYRQYEASISISSTPAPDIPQTDLPEPLMEEKYNPAVEKVFIDHALSELFPDLALSNESADMNSVASWVESVNNRAFTMSDIPDLVDHISREWAADTTPTNQVEAYAPDNIQDASSYAAESPAVEKYLDDILMDEAIDDAVLEAIADIFPVADDMVRREPDEPIKAEIFPPGF